MKTKKGLLGFYNYTVILTYISMLVAFAGIAYLIAGRFRPAVICLMVSGICDMFDGTIAATRPRKADEKRFGIQIDSLCDLICFGIFPALLVYLLNGCSTVSLIISGLYLLCALIRLAYFNVLEEERQDVETGHRTCYQGLPVTSVALVLPACFALGHLTALPAGPVSLVPLALMGLAFVLPIHIKKPYIVGKIALIAIGVCEFCVLLRGKF